MYLKLPLELDEAGNVLEEELNYMIVLRRLSYLIKIASNFNLPESLLPFTKGLHEVWAHLMVMSVDGKLCNKDILNFDRKITIEAEIKQQINNWFGDRLIRRVEILGDDNKDNGISLVDNRNNEFRFMFKYNEKAYQTTQGLGNWYFIEEMEINE